MYNVKIDAIGKCVPSVVSNTDFIKVFGKKASFIAKKIGYQQRYLATDIDNGKIIMTNTEMAYNASLEAIKHSSLKKDDIDMIIFSTATPDYLLPPSWTLLQEKLGIENCSGFDIRSGCSGFGAALIAAINFIKVSMAQNVLVVGSEFVSSRFRIYYNDKENIPLKALFNFMFFGDAAGAVILKRSKNEGFGKYFLGPSKINEGYGSMMRIGGALNPFCEKENKKLFEEGFVTQDYDPQKRELLFNIAIDKITEFMKDSANVNKFIIPVEGKELEKRLENIGIPSEKLLSLVKEGGSLANAAIPLALHRLWYEEKLDKINNILIYAAENTKWQYSILEYKVK